ncbi:DNA methyltransferase [Nocardioides bizhenqiangii]|uniref:DNA methyltransferase n=1 Tax=Nocardioides bizhenqiangii TaxID=3095076 RepID=A0ABZ0ZV13_9ACTN|nr:DNA methyltransferase [Nocardioides sp. HM61]WQQ27659.1 DNA methyltransferase [Nocardioides sp. HM61]
MSKSLLEQLPNIVAAGKRQAAQILEQLDGDHRVSLQTRELVIPGRDTSGADLFAEESRAEAEGVVAGGFGAMNRLIYGDNLLAMAALLAGNDETPSLRGKIDLIYIDPPFDSKADYRSKIVLPGATLDQKPNILEQFAYSDTWADGSASFLGMLTPRLALMRELLSDSGSIVVHTDWHVGHYVKILLDEIFGKDNFRNEIVWHYYNKLQGNVGRFASNHDVLFAYKKLNNPVYNVIRELRDKPKRQQKRAWDPATKTLKQARDEQGNLIYYEDTHRMLDDVWRLPYIMPADKIQKLNYPTQKPETLLARVIESASNEGDLIADFFVGSGTTAAVAERLGRRWVATDLGKPSAMMTRKRLVDLNAQPFLYQAIGDYQVEQARSTLGRSFRIGDLARVVLDIFGALPLPPEENVNGSLGRLPHSRTLVYADSPSKLTTVSTLRRARGYRDAKMGGFDKVIVLGWNFSAGIGHDISALSDDRLEVLVIPPDLLDRLKKKGADKIAGEVRFSSLQYLRATVEQRLAAPDGEVLRVVLDNYLLLSPDAINLDAKNREALQKVMNSEPLALIEYWAVDPDYDGQVFRSVWQDYRGNTENDNDPLRVVTRAQIELPPKDGSRTVCVRAVDVFGFESEVVIEDVDLP